MSSHPASGYHTLASFSRIHLLHFLRQRGTMTMGDLAEATGLHHNTAREHLQRLISDGFVTRQPENKESKGRTRIQYRATAFRRCREILPTPASMHHNQCHALKEFRHAV